MIPAHRHADPPPIPDGKEVPIPPRHATPARLTRRQKLTAIVVVGLVLALMIAGISGYLP